MTRDQAVALIKQILGFRSDKTTEIENQILFQQQELEHEPTLPYFLRAEVTDLTSTADDENLAVPTGFIREWDEDVLQVENAEGAWSKLVKDSPDYLRSVYQAETGIPVAYSYDGISGNFKLFPTPDAEYTFRLTYYKQDAVLSSNITNLWLTHQPFLLIGRVGVILASSLRDQNAIQIFSSMIQSETVKINALTTERDSRRYTVGGDD